MKFRYLEVRCYICKEDFINTNYQERMEHLEKCRAKSKEENKMKDKQFSPAETVKIDFLGTGGVHTVKFIRYVDDEYAEVVYDGISFLTKICKLTKLEENKMKHSCGKVFDSKLPVKLRRGNKARIICRDEKSVYEECSIGALHTVKSQFEEKEFEVHNTYFNCGHRYSCHQDYNDDLVNVEEKKNEIDLKQISRWFNEIIICLNSISLRNNTFDSTLSEIHQLTNNIRLELGKLNA